MQIAIVLPDDEVDELDRLASGEFRSRSEVVRVAVSEWLKERRAREIDARYTAAYRETPQHIDDIDSGRGQVAEPHPWDELEW